MSDKHFEGDPCVKCGSTTRYISTKRCVDCVKVSSAKWHKDNPEKAKANADKYYLNGGRKKKIDRAKKWYKDNPEKAKEIQRRHREKVSRERKENLNTDTYDSRKECDYCFTTIRFVRNDWCVDCFNTRNEEKQAAQ